jgi:two-component system cell cycle sensor histidine kinase/response regulator CckA
MALTLNNLHILFVDDDADLVYAAIQMLTRLGCVVTGETQGWRALRVFLEHSDDLDLAILNVIMADLTGLELAQRFRQIQPDVPVILYGADINSSTLRETEETGISWCDKPATGEDLERFIRQVLKR